MKSVKNSNNHFFAYNNKDFLTLTSIYTQHLLRLKSLKKLSTISKILKAKLIQSATSHRKK